MKTLIALFVMIAASSSFARVGETIDDLKKRYGEPKKHNLESRFQGSVSMEHYIFEKDGITIQVIPKKGVSSMEIYKSPKKLTPEAVKALLIANNGGSDWIEKAGGYTNQAKPYFEFETKDRTRGAKYFTEQDDGGETIIVELREVAKVPSGF